MKIVTFPEILKDYQDAKLAKSYRREKQRVENAASRYYHGRVDTHYFYNYLYRFLEKSIGRPYGEVYGEFCAKWPVIYCGTINTRAAIESSCFSYEHQSWIYNEFEVDKNGILRRNPRYFHNHKEKYQIVGYIGEPTYQYEFNKRLFRYHDIVDYLYDVLGYYNTLTLKLEQYIPKDILSLLEWRTHSRSHDWKFIEEHRRYSDCDRWIYRKVTINKEPIKIERGTKEFKKYFAEKKKQLDRQFRVSKEERKRMYDSLLHDIEEKRKNREQEQAQDIIDRDRLGFDENSFRGEFYHGQKRKKNRK